MQKISLSFLVLFLIEFSSFAQNAAQFSLQGNQNLQAGKYEEAIVNFGRAIDLAPNVAANYFNRGIAYTSLQKYNEALKDYDKAISLNPRESDYFNRRGIVKYYQDLHKEAIADYTQALQLNPRFGVVYTNQALAKYKLKDYKAAIEDYSKHLQIEPDYANTYDYRGQAKYFAGDYQGAIQDFNQFFTLQPNQGNATTYNILGLAYYALNDYLQAVNNYMKAIEKQPDDGVLYYNLGLAQKALNNQSLACQNFDKSYNLGFKNALDEITGYCGGSAAERSSTVYTVQTVPDPKARNNTYVSDPDGFLKPNELDSINAAIEKLNRKSTVEMAVVIVNSIGSSVPKTFATELFNYWGIGKKDKNNGLLLLLVMNQRRYEFETGYGLEGVLPDLLTNEIGTQALVPKMREGKYGEGILATVKRIDYLMDNPETLAEVRSEVNYRNLPWWQKYGYIYLRILAIFHLIVAVSIILILYIQAEPYQKYQNLRWFDWVFWCVLFPIPYIAVYFGIKKLLRQMRDAPRYSKVNGKQLFKLSEQEDDTHLLAGQITEEKIESVDYDVWATEDKDDILVLRYDQRFSEYSSCPKCKFKAYYLVYSKTLVAPTYSSSGRGETKHACKHCNHSVVRTYSIAQLQKSSSSSSSSSGSSWSSSSSSSGGSWGGGSSGGGGSGGNW